MKGKYWLLISLLIVNLGYNMLTISQYVSPTRIHFYNLYAYVVGSIMILELLYLVWINEYVTDYRIRRKYNNTSTINIMFRNWWRGRFYIRAKS